MCIIINCLAIFENKLQGKYKMISPSSTIIINIRDVKELNINKQ